MSKKNCLIAVVIVLVVIIILAACAGMCILFSNALSSSDISSLDSKETEVIVSGGDDKIVVIEVEGLILDTESESDLWGSAYASAPNIIDQLEYAMEDDSIKAVILSMDTPGGDVYASDIIYNKVLEAQGSGLKIITLMKNTAASGGYYIAAPSDKIVASPITITGSIGVRMDVQSMEGLYEKLGIETRTLTNSGGEFKTGEGLFDDDPKGEEDQIYQDIVDEFYNRFVDIVASGRGMPRKDVIELADGSIFTGTKAKEVGLIDILGDIETAIETAEKEAGISDATVIKYKDLDFWSMLAGYAANIVNPTARILENIDPTPGLKARFLYGK